MNTRKVLIIDDEANFGLLLKAYLTHRNYDVYVSYTLTEGIKMLEDLQPNVLFLDNNLPDGLGWDKTEFILSHHPFIELNLISAYYYDKPNAITSSVKIWEKPLDVNELNKYLADYSSHVEEPLKKVEERISHS